MFINLHAIETLGPRVAGSPAMKASLFALQNSFYLIFVLLQLYLAKICWMFSYKQQIYEKKIYL